MKLESKIKLLKAVLTNGVTFEEMGDEVYSSEENLTNKEVADFLEKIGVNEELRSNFSHHFSSQFFWTKDFFISVDLVDVDDSDENLKISISIRSENR